MTKDPPPFPFHLLGNSSALSIHFCSSNLGADPWRAERKKEEVEEEEEEEGSQ